VDSSSEDEAEDIQVPVSSDDDADDILNQSSEEDTGISEAEASELENSGGELENEKGRQKRKMWPENANAKKQKKGMQEDENVPKQRLNSQNKLVESESTGTGSYKYQVGEFVTAVYENVWLVAQVDIDQDKAGDTHVNLNYMERVGYNQFKWPKNHDLLLTLREDILTRCAPPGLVGSTIRANHVGLSAIDARAADVALAAVPVFYLKPNFNIFHHLIFLLFFSRSLFLFYSPLPRPRPGGHGMNSLVGEFIPCPPGRGRGRGNRTKMKTDVVKKKANVPDFSSTDKVKWGEGAKIKMNLSSTHQLESNCTYRTIPVRYR
jgi:hypothetical protein